MTDRIDEAASAVFGLERLRAGQRPAVEALLDGHDVLLVQPTGAGKSLAYQLAAVLIDGPTLVVSPLLALQQDQTDHLAAYGGRTRARRVSSAETPKQREEALAEAARGEVEFLFLAPEQLANDAVHAAVDGPAARAWSPSTRRTACRRGATTSAPTTCGWASCWPGSTRGSSP